jgi:hypothetical protein
MSIAAYLPPKQRADFYERKLWMAIFASAIRQQDRRFFEERGGPFETVCRLIGWPLEKVRQQILTEFCR